ncbi:MAG: DUF58 domain-containing protein [Phycisphaerales bacterium]|nr:DUF58 domain-containing protein [Planctomycetota bacterium]MBL6997426.1 DUF58 domain-containing protein [Phycisphaerales bacterium]
MSNFGETIHDRPSKVDELLGSHLMSSLDSLDIVARKIFSGKTQGERKSRRRGSSVEFADYRQYTSGDDLRFIDWNVYARLDRLFMKIFLEEEELTLGIAVDASASMEFGNPNKFDFARRLAMALGYVALSSHNKVSLFGFNSDGVQRLTGLRGRRRTRDMGQWLLDLLPSGGTSFVDACKVISTSRQGRGVLVVLSDCLEEDGITQGLSYLVGGGWDVFVIQSLAPEEVSPLDAGLEGDLRLEDSESGAECEITATAPLVAKYKQRLEQYCESIREQCIRIGAGSVRVSTDVDMEQLLVEYLRGRGLLR